MLGDGARVYQTTSHFEQDVLPVTAYQDPSDFWFWDSVVAEHPTHGSALLPFVLDDPMPGEVDLEVSLYGYSHSPGAIDHRAVIYLNGTPVGETSWNGSRYHRASFPVSSTLLIDGENTLVVRGELPVGVSVSSFFVDSFDLSYSRLYRAVDDALVFSAAGNSVITVDGFSSSDITVFNISSPAKPVRLTETATANGVVTFRPDDPGGTYLATVLSDAPSPHSIVADQPSQLWAGSFGAEYLVIAPSTLVEAAWELADYRAGQGLSSTVVDLEDIYDQFNFGIADPNAIRRMLEHAWDGWHVRPRFVLLAGAGTLDYLDLKGLGGNLIPPILAVGPSHLYAADNRFADIRGEDGVPEYAIGRLPVLTPEELQASLAKISAFESSATLERILFAADDPDQMGRYPNSSNTMIPLTTPSTQVEKVYLSDFTVAEARQLVLDSLDAGVGLFGYLGHAGLTSLAHENLLTTTDVAGMSNPVPPIFAGMTCTAARFDIPGIESFAEALLIQPGGGAVAAWSSTEMSFNREAVLLEKAFLRALYQTQRSTLGEAILDAVTAFEATGKQPFMRDAYVVLGDPALRLPAIQ